VSKPLKVKVPKSRLSFVVLIMLALKSYTHVSNFEDIVSGSIFSETRLFFFSVKA